MEDTIGMIWVHSSGGEHYLDTVGVVGSNPTVPTSGNACKDAMVKFAGIFIL